MNNKKPRKGCKDVFHAYMVDQCIFDGPSEMPLLTSFSTEFPENIITYKRAREKVKHQQTLEHDYICFYTNDKEYESIQQGIWVKPNRWLPLLQQCKGVILPDLASNPSLPLMERKMCKYKSLSIGCYLAKHDIAVIPDFTVTDSDMVSYCADGIPNHSLISIDTYQLTYESAIEVLRLSLELLLFRKSIAGVIFYGHKIPESILQVLRYKLVPYAMYSHKKVRIYLVSPNPE